MFFEFLRDFESAFYINHAPLCTGSSITPVANIERKNAMHMIVKLGLRNCARLDRFLEIVAVKEFTGLFVVQSGGGRFGGAVRASPIGESQIP